MLNEPIQELSPTPRLNYPEWLRSLDLGAGVIRIDEAIRESSSSRILAEINQVKRRQLPKVTVVISSPGGGAYYSFAIYDALRELSQAGTSIEAIVTGWAASAAAMIVLQAADIRISRPSARFLLHEARRWVFWAIERTSDLKDEVEEMERITERILEILATRCKKTKDEIRKRMERQEVWMSATEAKDFGLIDEIQ
jgi:ATP-dependent Clp protease protease subunit